MCELPIYTTITLKKVFKTLLKLITNDLIRSKRNDFGIHIGSIYLFQICAFSNKKQVNVAQILFDFHIGSAA